MKPKLTPWFPGEVKPVHPGVYETRLFSDGGYSYWNGFKWGSEKETVHIADEHRNTFGADQHKPWRGLAEDPAKAAP